MLACRSTIGSNRTMTSPASSHRSDATKPVAPVLCIEGRTRAAVGEIFMHRTTIAVAAAILFGAATMATGALAAAPGGGGHGGGGHAGGGHPGGHDGGHFAGHGGGGHYAGGHYGRGYRGGNGGGLGGLYGYGGCIIRVGPACR